MTLRDSKSAFDPDDMYGFPADIHRWFNLTYASYLVMPRSLLRSMPSEWQERFVRCLNEFGDAFGHLPLDDYAVLVRGEKGRFTHDSIPPYRRGLTFVQPWPDRVPEGPCKKCGYRHWGFVNGKLECGSCAQLGVSSATEEDFTDEREATE